MGGGSESEKLEQPYSLHKEDEQKAVLGMALSPVSLNTSGACVPYALV